MDLTGKRVLLLATDVFGYPSEMKASIERLGGKADFFDERPANTFFIKAMVRINRNIIASSIYRYQKKIVEKTKEIKYDYVLVIRGEVILPLIIEELKELHNNSKFLLYQWDSFTNNKNALGIINYFDKIFTFDKVDSKKYGIEFLPLFYLNDFANVCNEDVNQDIDLLFVGTAHSDRYKLIMNVANQFKQKGLNFFFYIFFQSPILYYKMKLSDKSLINAKKSDFFFKHLNKKEIVDLYKRSKVVIDVQHPQQTGLTMRTFEVLASKRKFITTNTDVVNYDFYNSSNILVIDRDNPVITNEFLDANYYEISQSIYNKYSIDFWVQTILS